jgi:acetyl-CoA carboxylase biotin carboxyl carrier protein
MDLDKLKKFLELAKKENVAELDYQSGDLKVRVSFKQRSQEIYFPSTTASQPKVSSQTSGQTIAKVDEVKIADANSQIIKAPFVGTYYASAAPGVPAYVKVGDRVKKGQTVCILEAMKIMNEIESDCSGVVTEILVENENYVEYGQPLFKIKI